ncbi:hypothetical protein [Streptomyces sp. NPDC101150]|uniref:hypothetical protein n=1 Tax=Streptomyces sp. NPDC101150 TaxID=3366114 RepID=UPI0037F9306F
MGAICCRPCHVGHRPYDVGHYTHLTRAQYAALFDELDHPEQTPFLARCHPTWDPRTDPAL